ncbi:MAG: transcriptional repressor LexA [Burkholderiales bacterium]|nr:transcriptional repressor LexA [Burkholderiales bacterium]MDP2398883.1 transcriptional repressor LexA [Burkholderiales bacterium]
MKTNDHTNASEAQRALTPRQVEILRLIEAHVEESGFPPTRAEICSAMGFSSPNAAETHLRALERKGVIEMTSGASRGIRLMQQLQSTLPVIGRVAAGSPMLAEQNVEQRYRVDPALFEPAADYLLRVRGMSMRDAGILEGDLLAVHRTPNFRSGQIVVARLHDEVTVKRIHRNRNMVELLPENPEFQPIIVDLKREPLEIEGIAVGVIRNGKWS